MHPTLRVEILGLLEAAVLVGKQAAGRTGMDLWQSWCWASCAWVWTRTGIAWNTSPTTIP